MNSTNTKYITASIKDAIGRLKQDRSEAEKVITACNDKIIALELALEEPFAKPTPKKRRKPSRTYNGSRETRRNLNVAMARILYDSDGMSGGPTSIRERLIRDRYEPLCGVNAIGLALSSSKWFRRLSRGVYQLTEGGVSAVKAASR